MTTDRQQGPPRGEGESLEAFFDVLRQARDAFSAHGVDAVAMGGIASAALGRERWTHDIDFFVRTPDRHRALRALVDAGFETEETDQNWLYKGFKHGVLVDLIFHSKGIDLDGEMLARAPVRSVGGLRLKVLAPEDLFIVKVLVFQEETPRHWFDALGLLEHCRMDWDYLLRRAAGREHRVVSMLIFAQGEGMAVPQHVIRDLLGRIHPAPGE